MRVTGELIAPPEFATFSYKDFLARQGVYSTIERPRIAVLDHGQGSPILFVKKREKLTINQKGITLELHQMTIQPCI